MHINLSFYIYIATVSLVALAQRLPDSQAIIISELEHIYYDDTGALGFMSGLTPCTTYIDSTTGLPNNTLGRQTSAQWIRTAFRKDFPISCKW